jgi:hypothetical protein
MRSGTDKKQAGLIGLLWYSSLRLKTPLEEPREANSTAACISQVEHVFFERGVKFVTVSLRSNSETNEVRLRLKAVHRGIERVAARRGEVGLQEEHKFFESFGANLRARNFSTKTHIVESPKRRRKRSVIAHRIGRESMAERRITILNTNHSRKLLRRNKSAADRTLYNTILMWHPILLTRRNHIFKAQRGISVDCTGN